MIKHNKIWITKDKYVYRASVGVHWYLKKFIVPYKVLLVDRKVIDENVFKEISDNFLSFIKSITDPSVRADAEDFFFHPIDFRSPEKIINFQCFNDVPELDDAARKYFIIYLMKIGMQSGIKKAIGDLLYAQQDITVSKILKTIPDIKERVNQEQLTAGKVARSVTDSVETIFSDFHAEIRNYRQLLSYYGILPPEEDGYEFNEISRLIYKADALSILAIWEHQKMKMRFSNQFTRLPQPFDAEKEYRHPADFEDFCVHPYLALIETLHGLLQNDREDAFLSLDEYVCYICREAPFDLDVVIKNILYYRSLSEPKKEQVKKTFRNRPKTRTFSEGKAKPWSENFHKELSNLVYGISEYEYICKTDFYPSILKYENGEVRITNYKQFADFYEYTDFVLAYLNKWHNKFYRDLAICSSLDLIDELSQRSQELSLSSHYLKELTFARDAFQSQLSNEDVRFKIFGQWKYYISHIDYKLLICAYAAILAMKYNKKRIGEIKTISDMDAQLQVPDSMRDISGLTRDHLEKIIANLVYRFPKATHEFLSNDIGDVPQDTYEDPEEAAVWVREALITISYSETKKIIRQQHNELAYAFRKGVREKLRDERMKALAYQARMDDHLIMDEYRPYYPVDNCDCCNRQLNGPEPECHHIIPVEIDGPDVPKNYIFLCQNCHKDFTHKTRVRQRIKQISKLKKKRLITKSNFLSMVDSGDLHIYHLQFLHEHSYIHIIDKLDLLKRLKTAKTNLAQLDSQLDKTCGSKTRWTRAMKVVYFYRKKHHIVMEQHRPDYRIDACDACSHLFGRGEPECHHLVPKEIFGPETPYNYVYLCKNCHNILTHKCPKKVKIIKLLRDQGLLSELTVQQMVIANEVTDQHLQYLKDDGYIKEEELLRLFALKKEMGLF